MPVVLRQINDDRYQHMESLILVGLQNVQEVVILKETHRSVGHLQVDTSNTGHDSLEESGDQSHNFVNLANLQDFLQFGQEQGLLDAVGEWPVLEETIQKGDSQSPILSQKEHRAPQELLVELGACLNLVEGNINVLELNHVLVSQRHREPTDD